MKCQRLIEHLREHNVGRLREGANHTLVINRLNGRQSAVPRHREIEPYLVRKICRQPDVPVPIER